MRRTKEEALETRVRILNAAEAVFSERGVARPSLADIAKAAGVTRGAIYWHFKNKGDLFAAMSDRVRLPLDALCAPERIARSENALSAIRDICVFVMRQVVVNPHVRRVHEIIFHKCEMIADNGDILDRVRQSRQEGIAKLRGHLAFAVERGHLPPDLDIDLAVEAFHAAISGVMAQWLLAPESFDMDAQAPRFADTFIDAVRLSAALRKGYKPRPLERLPADVSLLWDRTASYTSDDRAAR